MTTDKMVAVTGNTYQVRDLLNDFGASWDKDARRWTMTEAQWEALRRKATPSYSRKIAHAVSALRVEVL